MVKKKNMSMASTRKKNVSMFAHFMDMFSERVHSGDM